MPSVPSENAAAPGVGWKIWGVDNVVYGPVELPTLVHWVKEERVVPTTWVYSEQADAWRKAADVPELRMFFRATGTTGAQSSGGAASPEPARDPSTAGLKAGSLRRVKIFGDFSDEQLDRFITFMEVENVKQWTPVVKQGETGDAMFLVLAGELRVRMMIGGKETILVTLGTGEFFGEISLFDQGPRSADVVANVDSILLKISAPKFETLLKQAPELAAPFLFAMSRTLTARIRADNKRYRDSVHFARASSK